MSEQTMTDEQTTAKIDLHSHWFAPSTQRLLGGRRTGMRLEDAGEGTATLVRGVQDGLPERFALGTHWFDIEQRLAHLESVGIIHQLLSWPTTLGLDPSAGPGELHGLWQAYNDDLGNLVRRYPSRFSGVAALSTSDIQWSARELARAHDSAGLIGAVLPVGVFSSTEAVERLRPLLEEGQRRRSHFYLHTGRGHASLAGQFAGTHAQDLPALRAAVNTAATFAHAVFTLLYSDVLDAYPDITVQVAMLGGAGTFANLLEQFLSAPQRYGEVDIGTRLARLTFDTGAAGNGSEAIDTVVRLLGAEQVVFGTDYAPLPDTRQVIANICRVPLQAAARQAIFHDNAARLLRDKGVSLPVYPNEVRP
ncbi:hypothetical protein D0894_27695 [Pseudomonas monteilii]|uniref:Amidohydrolase-related domain-containing protein n=2 Tax=Pseudomonas monteilii TaxID=76759 RepID=A0A399LXD8_9PSED|nr:hypothetical protein D0894_27695 [Pseudomonas monteilii]